MKRLVFMLVLVALSVLALFQRMPASAKTPGEYRMVLILPGAISDKGWNAMNFAGLQAVNKTLGTKMEHVENVQAADYESTMRNLAEKECDLIMAAGIQFDKSAAKVAPKFPKTVFCVVNGMTAAAPNVMSILPKEYEASFLAGIIAGHVTKSGKIGIAGGKASKTMTRLLNAYEWAARVGRSDLKVTRAYVNSWSDVALGKQMASSMIDGGADVLFFYANQVSLGAIQAAKEKGVKYIGFYNDQNDEAPGTVVASVYFDFPSLYTWVMKKYLDGTLKPVVNEAGIAEGIVKVSYSCEIAPEIRETVKDAEEAIKNGSVLSFLSGFPEKP